MKAVVANPLGGPENLKYIDIPKPELKNGEVLVKLEATGVNFIDVYYRTGLYKAPEQPVLLGSEGAGVVETSKSSAFRPGERVAYTMARGAYAEYAAVPESLLVPLPNDVTFEQGAAAILQGMTAHYLTHSTYALKPGQSCLIHAAAGGVGLLLVQMAKILGATVIAAAGSPEKAQLAKEHGADHAIVYTEHDFAEELKQITGGKGVEVVYDSVGKSTFLKSLDCLKPRGLMASFGNSSGAVDPIQPLLLSQKGSLFLTRPSLAQYISDAEELRWRSSDVFRWVAGGRLTVRIFRTYALGNAAQAHRDLEGRKTTGKLLLKP